MYSKINSGLTKFDSMIEILHQESHTQFHWMMVSISVLYVSLILLLVTDVCKDHNIFGD